MLESLPVTEKWSQVSSCNSVCNSLQREIYALINLPVAFAPRFLHLLYASTSVLSEKRRMGFKGSEQFRHLRQPYPYDQLIERYCGTRKMLSEKMHHSVAHCRGGGC